MKFLATYAGELPNSATFFLSFANVCTKTKWAEDGTFAITGRTQDGQLSTWRPWDWKKHLENVEAVEVFKKTLHGDLDDKTNRSKITGFIAKRKSRQEYLPPLGRLIEKATSEPLHLMNNTWQHMFEAVL